MDKEWNIIIAFLVETCICIGLYLYCIYQLGKAYDQKREEQRQQELERFRKRIRI